MHHSEKIFARTAIQISLFILCMVFPRHSLAGGSIWYDDLRAKFLDDGLTFDTLEQSHDFYKGDVMAQIRVLSDHPNKRFGGMRLGPYYACAKQKYGQHLLVLITFTTENEYFDKKRRKTDDFDDAVFIKEKLIGVRIEKADKSHPFQRCYDRGKRDEEGKI